MASYYDEILEEIQDLMDENKNEEAMQIVKKELSMPYIPSDVEPQLKKLKRELDYRCSLDRQRTEVSSDALLEKLYGKEAEQLSAAAALSSRNLREFLPEIQNWLEDNPFPEAAALMIEAIAEQDIKDDFTLRTNDVEYDFYGDSVTPVAESEGFLEADKLLYDWLGMKHPDLYEMARTLLIHEVYMFLPLSYEKEEAVHLALDVCEQVCTLMDCPDVLEQVRKNAHLQAGNYQN
ncbi:MAG: DUF3196 domain-containing protein [Erysipelotrichaceae bacterium]|nr:DUF3196 domain-containing protein [Erysipelotrichaceae bacterium]